MCGGLAERLFHDLHILDLEEMAHLGIDKLHYLFLTFLYVFKEFLLALQIPVNSAFIKLNQSYQLA